MIQVELLTPKGLFFQGDASFVLAPSVDGPIGILPNHAPLIALLREGDVRVDFAKGKSQSFRIDSGVIEVKNNKISLLSNEVMDVV